MIQQLRRGPRGVGNNFFFFLLGQKGTLCSQGWAFCPTGNQWRRRGPAGTVCLLQENSVFFAKWTTLKPNSNPQSYLLLFPQLQQPSVICGNNRYYSVDWFLLTGPRCADWVAAAALGSEGYFFFFFFADGLLFPHISFLTSLAITAAGPAITTTWPGETTIRRSPPPPSPLNTTLYFPSLQVGVRLGSCGSWMFGILAWWLVYCSRAPPSAPRTAARLWCAPCPASTACSTGHPAASARLSLQGGGGRSEGERTGQR